MASFGTAALVLEQWAEMRSVHSNLFHVYEANYGEIVDLINLPIISKSSYRTPHSVYESEKCSF